MYKRIIIYLKEMYPPFSRLGLAIGLFFTMYLLILTNNGIREFAVGLREWIAVLTIYTFLLSLRIADEFKDLDTDRKNFPQRPLPSGRVKQSDLITLLLIFQIPTIILNLLFMNNLLFFIMLYAYGALMSVWFFAKKLIKYNLFLALITHNPVQLLLNTYIASYICINYGLTISSPGVILSVIAFYLPGVIWEIGRKIRAPKDETAYTTYSKLWGYRRASIVIICLVLIATLADVALISPLSAIAAWIVVAVAALMLCLIASFIRTPTRFKFVTLVTGYIYTMQPVLLLIGIGYMMRWWS